jgi:hypothetical protein
VLVACQSVNWNWLGEISVALPSTVQLLKGRVASVVATTVKPSPGPLVKVNWHAPPDSTIVFVRQMGAIVYAPLVQSYSSVLLQ